MRSTQTISEGHSLLLITEVINGIDDLLMAKKLIISFKKANPKEKIRWLIFSTEQRKDLPERIKSIESEFDGNIPIDLVMLSKKINIDHYADVRFILMFPTLQRLSSYHFQQLKSLKVPMLQVYEYDGNHALQQMASRYELSYLSSVSSGFKGLGLFLDEAEQDKPFTSKMMDSDSERELFFSHINVESSGKYKENDFTTFYQIALKIADANKSVDFITNASILPNIQDFAALAWSHGFTSLSYMKKDPVTGELREEFSHQSRRQLSAGRQLRIISTVELSPAESRELMLRAHPFQQLTGDRLFTEAMSLAAKGKYIFPFYQVTVAKQEFFDHWLAFALAHLGEKSSYVELLKLVGADKKLEIVKFSEKWLVNQDELHSNAKKLYQTLKTEKDLYQHLPRFLSLLDKLGMDFASLIVQLIIKFSDATMIEAIISKLKCYPAFVRQSISQALTDFLMLNAAPINIQDCLIIIEQFEKIAHNKRQRAAVAARNILNLLPALLQSQSMLHILPVLETLPTKNYPDLLEQLKKLKNLTAFCEQPQWLSVLADRCEQHTIAKKTSAINRNILLAANMMGGFGDLIKCIGVYQTLSKALPDCKLYTLIRCLNEDRPSVLAMLRENNIPIKDSYIRSVPSISLIERRDNNENRFASKCDIAISVATPFPGFKDISHTYYIEVPEINYCSYPTIPLDRDRSETFEFQVMGIDEESVGLEITDDYIGDAHDLIQQMSPMLVEKLLDRPITPANIASFVKESFFMPAYLNSEEGVLSIELTLQLMEHHYRDKKSAVLWLYQLPFDVKSTSFLQTLKEKGYTSFVLYTHEGKREVVLCSDQSDDKQLRIVSGRANNKDFDLMFALAARMGIFAGCVGQNSFEKAVSFGAIPAFYAPPWLLALISQCQRVIAKLFEYDSEEYKTLSDWFDVLSTTSLFYQQRQMLLATDMVRSCLTGLLPSALSGHSQQLSQLHLTTLSENPDIVGRYPYAFGQHPKQMVEQFVKTHQLSTLKSGWETVCAYIIKNKNLSQWLIETVKSRIPAPSAAISVHSRPQLDEVKAISKDHRVALTKEQFPEFYEFVHHLFAAHWPDYLRHHLRFILTDSQEYIASMISGFDVPTIAISIKNLDKFTVEEVIFAIELNRTLFKNYPVESVGDAIGFRNNTQELVNGIAGNILRHGITFCRKMLERIAIYISKEEKRLWHSFREKNYVKDGRLQDVNIFYTDMIKVIETTLAEKNKHKGSQHEQSTSMALSDTILTEINRQCSAWDVTIPEPSLPGKIPVVITNDRTEIRRLLDAIPVLKIRHESERIYPRPETKAFLLSLEALIIDETDPDIVSDLTRMIDLAYEYKFPQFTVLYRLVSAKLKQAHLEPMGVFGKLKSAIDQLVGCNESQLAIAAADFIETFVTAKDTKFLFVLSEVRKIKLELESYAADEVVVSEIGVKINWISYLSWTESHLNRLIDWASNDESAVLAKVLFRLDVTQRKELWARIPVNFIGECIVSDQSLFSEGIGGDFQIQFFQHLYSSFTPVSPDNISVSAMETFIETNKIILALYEFVPGPAQHLMQLFHLFLKQSESEAKVFINNFFVNRTYPYGLYALAQTRRKYYDRSFELIGEGREEVSPYLDFILRSRPDYIDFFAIVSSMSNNLFVWIERGMLPVSFFITYLKLDISSLEATVQCVEKLEAQLDISTDSYKILDYAIKSLPAETMQTITQLSLFSRYLYQFITGRSMSRESLVTLWARNDIRSEIARNDIDIELSVTELATLYKLFDKCLVFPNYALRDRFAMILWNKLIASDDAEKLAAIEVLIFSAIPIADPRFANKLCVKWAELQAKRIGKDDLSGQFYQAAIRLIQKVANKSSRIYRNTILENLLVSIEAQAEVCQIAAEVVGTVSITKQADTFISVTDSLVSMAGTLVQRNLADETVEYLTSDVSDDTSTVKYGKLLNARGGILAYLASEQECCMTAINFYHQFWELNLEERAVIVNHLLMPAKTLVTEQTAKDGYRRALDIVISKLFVSGSQDNDIAEALLESHLDTANLHIKPYLLTATITATQKFGPQQQTLVAALPKIAEAKGAAGVKAAQAAHSYQGTPKNIRDSLAHLKSRARLPFRWELIHLIQKRLPKVLYDDIYLIGELLGGASFYIAVEVILKNGKTAVIRLLRENAQQEIESGFPHLAATIELCEHEKVDGIKDDLKYIIEEATKSAYMEIDDSCVQEQYATAHAIYRDKQEQVVIDEKLYRVNIQPVVLYASGPGFQLISKADGKEFNDLKHDPAQRELCQAVAFAVCKTELVNILGDGQFDPDRHGAQGCIKPVVAADGGIDVTITYFDFGEISPKPDTPAQLKHCHDFFKQATAFSFSNVFKFAFSTNNLLDDLRDKLIEYIRKHHDAGEDLSRLRRILKASLALQDYFEVLKDSKDLMDKLKDVAMQQLKQHAASVVPVSMFGQLSDSVPSLPSIFKFKQ